MLTLILRLYPFLRKKSTFLSNEYIFCKWTSFSTVMPNNSLKALSYQLRVYFYLPSPAICEIEKYHLGQRAIVWESQHKIKNMKKVFFMPFSQASKKNKNSRFNLFLYLSPLLQKWCEGLSGVTCCENLWVVGWVEFGSSIFFFDRNT